MFAGLTWKVILRDCSADNRASSISHTNRFVPNPNGGSTLEAAVVVPPVGRAEVGRQEPLTFSERSFIGRIGGYLLPRGIRLHPRFFPAVQSIPFTGSSLACSAISRRRPGTACASVRRT